MGQRKRILQIIQEKKHAQNVSVIMQEPEVSEAASEIYDPQPGCSQSIQHQISDICIRSWLEKHPQGPKLIVKLETASISPFERRMLIRLVCHELVRHCNSAYPTSRLKEEVAKCIVKEFPMLRSRFSEGHESFYDAKTGSGFLEYRLKTIRKSLTPTKKPYRRQTTLKEKIAVKMNMMSSDVLTEEELQEKIMWMKLKKPVSENKAQILHALNETRGARQRNVKENHLSITEVLDLYPRLMDFEGEMIDREFMELYPNSDNFLGKFQSYYMPRILRYTENHKRGLLEAVNMYDDELRALFVLPELLPIPNYGKGKGKKGKGATKIQLSEAYQQRNIPNSSLIQFVKVGEDIRHAIDKITSKQPMLICSLPEKLTLIKADAQIIQVGKNIFAAFDLLFKFHFVFNVEYAHELANFYDFLSSCVYGLTSPRPSSDALDIDLRSFPLDV